MMEPEVPPWMGCNRGKEVEAASRSFFGNLTSKKRPKEDSVISVARSPDVPLLVLAVSKLSTHDARRTEQIAHGES